MSGADRKCGQADCKVGCEDSARVLLQELGAEVRDRRSPEHQLAVGTVAGLGAVAWGVAALAASAKPKEVIAHGAWTAAAGSILITGLVTWKIWHEHRAYVNARKAQQQAWRKVTDGNPADCALIPERFFDVEGIGWGHWISLGIVVASGLTAAIFCWVLA